MTEIITILLTLAAKALADRYAYARSIAKQAAPIVAMLPEGNARKAAELAVIAANQSEIEREIRRQAKAKAAHDVRIAAIKAGAGDVNVGSLKRED